jgi:pimeloyl-ACP methyl ester carboxylesterase
MRLRIGLNLGEIIVDDDGDIFGDDVNVAARLQALADPGGIVVSGKLFDQVEDAAICSFESRGKQQLKNIAKPVRLYAVAAAGEKTLRAVDLAAMKQEVQYCRSPDGVRLAWAKVGHGPPLVKTANWMNHLETDWHSSVWGHWFHKLARKHTLIRYDARGNGMSDWEVAEVSLEAFVRDLEAVVEAAKVACFPLLGISQGAAVSIAYAVRRPDRVSHLILYGGFALGPLKRSPEEKAQREAFTTLVRFGWEDQIVREIFASRLIPDGTPDQKRTLAEQQRIITSAECAARYLSAVGNFDIRDLLPQVKAPTLVMNTRGDITAPLEAAKAMASGIPGARFVVLPGNNHILLEDEPATDRFFEELDLFLA